MKSVVLALALLTGCAPTYRVVTKKCPPTASIVSDVLVGSALLAVSTIKWANEKYLETAAYGTGAMAIFVGANLSEATTCRK